MMSVQGLVELAGVIFAAGIFYGEMKAIRKDIARLERKQDKYNNLQERTLRLEVWRKWHEREDAP